MATMQRQYQQEVSYQKQQNVQVVDDQLLNKIPQPIPDHILFGQEEQNQQKEIIQEQKVQEMPKFQQIVYEVPKINEVQVNSYPSIQDELKQQQQQVEYNYQMYIPPAQEQQIVANNNQLSNDISLLEQMRYPSVHQPQQMQQIEEEMKDQSQNMSQFKINATMESRELSTVVLQQSRQTDVLGIVRMQEDQVDVVGLSNQGVINQQHISLLNYLKDDYFQISSPSKKEQEEKIMNDFKKLEEKQQKILNFTNSFKSQKEEQKKEENIEDKLENRPQEMIGQDGQVLYVVHNIAQTDTLDGISIRYNVRKDLIQRANEFTGDEIYMKKQLIIPYTNGILYKNATPEMTEEMRRKDCLYLMNRALIEKYKGQKDYLAEATYYLELTNYDLGKAMDEFEEDLKFEKEQEQKYGKITVKSKVK